MSLSKPSDESTGFPKSLLKGYMSSMQRRPILTKSCTRYRDLYAQHYTVSTDVNDLTVAYTFPVDDRAVTGGLASLLSQAIIMGEFNPKEINWRSVSAYAGAGFVFIGPAVHHFHAWLDRVVPKGTPNMALKRLLLDRILFSPNFLLIYLYILAVFEGLGHKGGIQRIKFAYLPALMMNLKVWTVLQYINVRYIPQHYRAPFMSFMALLWTVYIATRQRV